MQNEMLQDRSHCDDWWWKGCGHAVFVLLPLCTLYILWFICDFDENLDYCRQHYSTHNSASREAIPTSVQLPCKDLSPWGPSGCVPGSEEFGVIFSALHDPTLSEVCRPLATCQKARKLITATAYESLHVRANCRLRHNFVLKTLTAAVWVRVWWECKPWPIITQSSLFLIDILRRLQCSNCWFILLQTIHKGLFTVCLRLDHKPLDHIYPPCINPWILILLSRLRLILPSLCLNMEWAACKTDHGFEFGMSFLNCSYPYR